MTDQEKLVRSLMNLGIKLAGPMTLVDRKRLVSEGVVMLERYEERFKY